MSRLAAIECMRWLRKKRGYASCAEFHGAVHGGHAFSLCEPLIRDRWMQVDGKGPKYRVYDIWVAAGQPPASGEQLPLFKEAA